MLWRKAQTKCMILRSEYVSWIWPAEKKFWSGGNGLGYESYHHVLKRRKVRSLQTIVDDSSEYMRLAWLILMLDAFQMRNNMNKCRSLEKNCSYWIWPVTLDKMMIWRPGLSTKVGDVTKTRWLTFRYIEFCNFFPILPSIWPWWTHLTWYCQMIVYHIPGCSCIAELWEW